MLPLNTVIYHLNNQLSDNVQVTDCNNKFDRINTPRWAHYCKRENMRQFVDMAHS